MNDHFLLRCLGFLTSRLVRLKRPGRWPSGISVFIGRCSLAAGLSWEIFRPVRASRSLRQPSVISRRIARTIREPRVNNSGPSRNAQTRPPVTLPETSVPPRVLNPRRVHLGGFGLVHDASNQWGGHPFYDLTDCGPQISQISQMASDERIKGPLRKSAFSADHSADKKRTSSTSPVARQDWGNSLIQTAEPGCHDHGVLDMVVLVGDWRFSSHGQTEDGLTVAPELNNGTALPRQDRGVWSGR